MASDKKNKFPWLTAQDIAHRGLFEEGTLAEENSIASVQAAIDAGFAVEIDVRRTADDIIMVFHDATLGRLTDGEGPVSKWGKKQLQNFTVGNTGLPIPTLPDIMDVIDNQIPVFIEIKSPS
ncbi:MAG: hypothetical protein JKY60_17980, partial [Kordiimonadaceae bacterium]|nr:hypothetical protein [Kordiimonadaceae bacterium]